MDMTPHGKDTQVSEYFKYQTDNGGKTTVRLSGQSGKVLTIIKKESRADKGFESGRIREPKMQVLRKD